MAGSVSSPNWTDQNYNCFRLIVGKHLPVLVSWDSLKSRSDPTGYKVTVNGQTLVRRYADLEEAKQVGEAILKKWLQAALEELG